MAEDSLGSRRLAIGAPLFFLTAAEHSADALGAALIHALKRRHPTALFVGVGGEKMKAAGCRLLANSVTRSAMLVGAVSQTRFWYKLVKAIKREIQRARPDVFIPIDSSAVNLSIGVMVRKLGVPVCYYVAPQLWASRPWRVGKLKRAVNTLCCVLPFEERYFREKGVNAVYVGHPMFDVPADAEEFSPLNLDPPLPGIKLSTEAGAAGRGGGTRRLPFARVSSSTAEAAPDSPRVAVFPGSRKAEIDAHMPAMLEILSEIKGRFPRVNFVASAPSEERAWQIRHHLRNANTPIDIRVGSSDAIIRWADLVIVKSGTTTLQAARHAKPMIVMYRVSPILWHGLAKFFINTKYISLVNILAGRELVPEYVPFYGSPLPVAREAIELLAKPELRRTMSRELEALIAPMLPRGGVLAADRVADEVEKLMRGEGSKSQKPEGGSPELGARKGK